MGHATPGASPRESLPIPLGRSTERQRSRDQPPPDEPQPPLLRTPRPDVAGPPLERVPCRVGAAACPESGPIEGRSQHASEKVGECGGITSWHDPPPLPIRTNDVPAEPNFGR